MEDSGRNEVLHNTLHARREEGEEVERQSVVEFQLLLTHTSTSSGHLVDHVILIM